MALPPTPVSKSVIIRTLGEWKCLLCDVSAVSYEQMQLHVSGERHAYSLANIKARADEYFDYSMMCAMKTFMPDYPSMFPPDSKLPELIEKRTRIVKCDSTPETGVELETETIVSTRPTALEEKVMPLRPRVDSEIQPRPFFSEFYLNVLPEGVFFCEACLRTMHSVAAFLSHFTSREHLATLEGFERNETDYFQPVRDGTHVFFIGMLTRSVVVAEDFYERRRHVLELQWKLANRVPSPESTIMCANVRKMVSYLCPATVSQRLIRGD